MLHGIQSAGDFSPWLSGARRKWISRRGRAVQTAMMGPSRWGSRLGGSRRSSAHRIPMLCHGPARVGRGRALPGRRRPRAPGRERRDAAPNRRKSGKHFGLPKTEGRAPRCGDARRGDNANASPFDGLPVMSGFSGVPNQAKPPTMPERPTKGAEIGARLRARTNPLADTARESARLRGMPLIYGHGRGHQVHAPGR